MNERVLVECIARVESSHLGVEDHGCFTVSLTFDFGGSFQGLGHIILDKPVRDDDGKFLRRECWEYGLEFVARLMSACSVSEWKQLAGRQVYVLRDSDGWNGKIVGIRPLPFDKGKEFIFADLLDKAATP